MRFVPIPSMRAPSPTRNRQTSWTCGSQAAFSITVSPEGERSGHDRVLGAGHAGLVEEHPRADQRAFELVVLADRDPRAERVERVHVRVDATPADDVAARRGHDRLTAAGQQRPGEEDRGPNLAAQLLVQLVRRDLRCVDAHLVRARPLRVGSDVAQQRQHRVDVPDARDVLERDRLRGEHAAGEDRQRGVLVPGRAHAAGQAAASLDHERLLQRVCNGGLHGASTLPRWSRRVRTPGRR